MASPVFPLLLVLLACLGSVVSEAAGSKIVGHGEDSPTSVCVLSHTNNNGLLSYQCPDPGVITCTQGDVIDVVAVAAGTGETLLSSKFYMAGGPTTCMLLSSTGQSSSVTLTAPLLDTCHFQEQCIFCWSNWLTWACYSSVQKGVAIAGIILATLCGLSLVQRAAEGLFYILKWVTLPLWGPLFLVHYCKRRRAATVLQRSVHSAADSVTHFFRTRAGSEMSLPLAGASGRKSGSFY